MIVTYDIQSGSVERMFENCYHMRSIAIGPRLISAPLTVRIDWLPYPKLYLTIQDAYEGAMDLDVIQIQAGEFDEDIDIHLNKSVFITGGLDSSFSNITGSTTVNGTIAIN